MMLSTCRKDSTVQSLCWSTSRYLGYI